MLDGPLAVIQPSGSQMGFLKVCSVSGNERRTEEQPQAQQYRLRALSIWVLGRNLSKCNGCPVVLDIGNVGESGVGVEVVIGGGGDAGAGAVIVVAIGGTAAIGNVGTMPCPSGCSLLWDTCQLLPTQVPQGVLPPVIHLLPGAFHGNPLLSSSPHRCQP